MEKILHGELDGGARERRVVRRLSLAANVRLWIGARVDAGHGVVRVENLHVDTLRCIVQFTRGEDGSVVSSFLLFFLVRGGGNGMMETIVESMPLCFVEVLRYDVNSSLRKTTLKDVKEPTSTPTGSRFLLVT